MGNRFGNGYVGNRVEKNELENGGVEWVWQWVWKWVQGNGCRKCVMGNRLVNECCDMEAKKKRVRNGLGYMGWE